MKNLASAYIKAQQEMAPLLKDTKGNFGKYATLASVQDVCLPAFCKYGIAAFQTATTLWDEGRVYVRINCTLIHADSGEEMVCPPLDLVPTKTDPQGIGSAITYGRRYSLMAIAGIAPEDDDGQLASSGKVDAPKTQNKQPNAAPTPAQRQPEAITQPATNGANGNGHTEKPTEPQPAALPAGADEFAASLVQSFKIPADAWKWAADGKYTDNEHSARTRWTQLVNDAGGYTPKKFPELATKFVAHYLTKQQSVAA